MAKTIWVRLGIKDDATKKSKRIFGQMRSQIASLGVGFAAVGFFKGAINQASSLHEQLDSINRQFGIEGVRALEKYGKAAAKISGVSRKDVALIANQFSGLFRTMNLSSEETIKNMIALERAVGDLGSQFEKENVDIFTGLQSALSGKTSIVMRQMGIFLDQVALQARIAKGEFVGMGVGINDVFRNLSVSQKVLVRFRAFMKDAKIASGNFVKTAGTSFANQMKMMKAQFANLQAEVGNRLLPTLVKAITWVNDNLNKLVITLGTLMGMFIGFKLGSFVGEMIKVIALLSAAMLAKIGFESGLGAFATVPAAAGALGAIIGGVAGGVGLSKSIGASSSIPKRSDKMTQVNVYMDPIAGNAKVNGSPYNVITNTGRGGK